jgi:hypothetical protein
MKCDGKERKKSHDRNAAEAARPGGHLITSQLIEDAGIMGVTRRARQKVTGTYMIRLLQ